MVIKVSWRAIFYVLGLLALAAPACAQGHAPDTAARHLIDHLYSISGQLPIQTLIVDLDVSGPINPREPHGNLRPASKDKIFFKRPNKLHVDSVIIDPGGPLDGKQLTIIRDGINAWMFISNGEYPVKKKADEPSPTLWLPFHMQVYAEDAGKQYAIITHGDKTFGTPAEVVKISQASDPKATTTVWIDTRRWVPLALEVVTPATKPGDPDTVKRVIYKDFRTLQDGRYFPFKLEIYTNGNLTSAGEYKAVGINANLPDSLFEPMNRFIK